MLRILCIALFTIWSHAATAQWIHTSNKDAFDDKTTQMALVPSGSYALGFACTSRDAARLILLTPETYEKEFAMAGLLGSKLLIRIDELPIRKLDVSFDEASGKLRAVAEGAGTADAAKEMIGAKQRIAVAIEIADKKFHSNTFGVANSRNAVGKSLKGCSIE